MVSDGMGGRLPWSDRPVYRIVARKRQTGERIAGVCRWDGLSSLYWVSTDDAREVIVSELDQIDTFEPFPACVPCHRSYDRQRARTRAEQ